MTTHPRSFYIVTTVYPDAGFASAGDAVTHFDEAVDQWIACRDEGREARVTFVDPEAGTATNVTAQAMNRARYFWQCNCTEAPQWAAE